MGTSVNEKVLKIEREAYTSKDNESRYTYFVSGVIRNKEVRASLIPGDIGGYDVLDIVFGEEETADLVLIPYSMVDEKSDFEFNEEQSRSIRRFIFISKINRERYFKWLMRQKKRSRLPLFQMVYSLLL